VIEVTTEVPTAGNRPYAPYGAVEALWLCRDLEVVIEGPAGTGKTRGVLEKIHLLAEKYPESRHLLLRKTRESLTDSVLVTFENEVLPAGHSSMSGAARNNRHSYQYANGSEVVVGGLDKSSRVMSSQYDTVSVFEATEISEGDWEQVTTRARNGVMPYQQCICDCNPDAPTHWINKRADAGKMKRLPSRHTENPRLWNGTGWTAQGKAYMARLAMLTSVRRARLLEGKWAAAEGQVYETWDDTRHLIDRMPVPADWRRIRVIDFGYTNPFVCQWWAIDGDGRMYLYRELYQTRALVSDMAKRIIELSQGEQIEATIADHDAEDRATLEREGIYSLPAAKAVAPGIEAVQARLRVAGDGKPRLFVLRDSLVERDQRLAESKKPVCTSQEFASYVWVKSADGRPVKEQPVKIDDHGMDAMRYGVAFVDGLERVPLTVSVASVGVVEPTEDERIWH